MSRDTPTINDALALYERVRRMRVERVVRYAARIGRTKFPGPIGRWFRDLCMPAALTLFANPGAHAWLYRYHIDWNDA